MVRWCAQFFKAAVAIDGMSANMLRAKVIVAIARQGSFKVAFGGHSVCAGHGNWFNESYVEVRW